MSQQTVAVVFDFDETLAPDSTSSFLESIGINVPEFWKENKALVKKGWDPIPAYLQQMIAESQRREPGKRITREKLSAWGSRIKTYAGVGSLFGRLRKLAKSVSAEINIEFYLVSSGIAEVLRATKIAGQFSDIWACDFSYNAAGEIEYLKNVVSFSDKTRFLFQISKGITGARGRSEPFAVNEKVAAEKLHVPLDQMIVIGDGYTDIPCFSLVQKNHGIAIGVYNRESRDRWGKAWGFIENQRVTHIVAADYRKNSGLDDALSMAVERVCRNITLRGMTYRG
jgi:hypothetical protein